MAITTTCANGHVLKVKDEFAGKSGLCPHCNARVFVPMPIDGGEARISDDEILGLLDRPAKVKRPPAPAEPLVAPVPSEPAIEPRKVAAPSGPTIGSPGPSMQRNQQVCPHCSHLASVSFTHCPCCGTPLPEIVKAKK